MELDVHRRAICLTNNLTTLDSSLHSFLPMDAQYTISGTEYSFVRESPRSQDFVLVKQGTTMTPGGFCYNPGLIYIIIWLNIRSLKLYFQQKDRVFSIWGPVN